jgi:hypothetical protein
MIYLYCYLGVGVVTLVVMYVAHKWSSRSESEGIKDILDATNPDRHKLSYRIINTYLVPALAAVLVLFVWPIVIYMKINDLRNKGASGGYEEKVFKVTRGDLLDQKSIEQIESAEIVDDPLLAVPSVPFGHLNKCWEDLISQMQPVDELWSFKTTWDGNWGRKEIRSGYAIVREGIPEAYILTARIPVVKEDEE